jgi:ribosomal protein S18 acetylase RimI-like enzyme
MGSGRREETRVAGNNLILRDARPQEYDEIAGLTVEAYREFARTLSPQDWMTMEANLRSVEKRGKEGSVIVAEQDGELVGAVAYFAPGAPRHERFPPEWALVIMLAVDWSHRRKGAGKLLTEECVRRSRLDGARQVGLHTSELMTAARSLYEKMGFRQRREFQLYGVRYWIYVLRLK